MFRFGVASVSIFSAAGDREDCWYSCCAASPHSRQALQSHRNSNCSLCWLWWRVQVLWCLSSWGRRGFCHKSSSLDLSLLSYRSAGFPAAVTDASGMNSSMPVVTGLKVPHFLNKILGNILIFVPFSSTDTADTGEVFLVSFLFWHLALLVGSFSENSDFLLIFSIIIL